MLTCALGGHGFYCSVKRLHFHAQGWATRWGHKKKGQNAAVGAFSGYASSCGMYYTRSWKFVRELLKQKPRYAMPHFRHLPCPKGAPQLPQKVKNVDIKSMPLRELPRPLQCWVRQPARPPRDPRVARGLFSCNRRAGKV